MRWPTSSRAFASAKASTSFCRSLMHAECHIPIATVERLRHVARLYGVFMLPSAGVLDLDYVSRLHTAHRSSTKPRWWTNRRARAAPLTSSMTRRESKPRAHLDDYEPRPRCCPTRSRARYYGKNFAGALQGLWRVAERIELSIPPFHDNSCSSTDVLQRSVRHARSPASSFSQRRNALRAAQQGRRSRRRSRVRRAEAARARRRAVCKRWLVWACRNPTRARQR